jgi:hypothetical protein
MTDALEVPSEQARHDLPFIELALPALLPSESLNLF